MMLMRTHYCFVKRLDKNDCSDEDVLKYKQTQQALFINDLLRFNVETVPLDSYSQITDILQNLERIYRTKSVFISGAAHEWGPTWPTERARAAALASASGSRPSFCICLASSTGVKRSCGIIRPPPARAISRALAVW